MDERISEELRVKLHELARVQEAYPGDLNDEHERWALYLVAIRQGLGIPQLFDLLPLEPELDMASSAVVNLVERVAPEERRAWLSRIPQEAREYPEGRVAELETVDAILSGDLPASHVAGNLDSWSNWLQLRITDYVEDPTVLEILAEHGRTKRIRRQAAAGL
ncbi:hypothetical protein [Nonomuraea typhae]|uniref:hypothetical protein n=1 Tax=Nonomuraea typhae TaxID=2603600 RepID=UPI0012FAF5BD|nr:hypothetical protein [Nonomuraea typhae]